MYLCEQLNVSIVLEWRFYSIATAKVLLENGWNSKQMITEGEAAIPLKTTLHAFRNQEKTKQRSTIIGYARSV